MAEWLVRGLLVLYLLGYCAFFAMSLSAIQTFRRQDRLGAVAGTISIILVPVIWPYTLYRAVVLTIKGE